MNYQTIKQGVFVERPNRFIARVLVDGVPETVHVKNTGRCREILRPGALVVLEKADRVGRKTSYSLIGVYKGNMLLNIDSQAPNRAVYEGLSRGLLPEFQNLTRIAREVRFGQSRFDLYYERASDKGFIEVKGVTLERDGTALFPDAPTVRGVKHLAELARAVKAGYQASVFFLIQMKGPRCFQPNTATDPDFARSLLSARDNGVKIFAYDSVVTEDSLNLGESVPVDL